MGGRGGSPNRGPTAATAPAAAEPFRSTFVDDTFTNRAIASWSGELTSDEGTLLEAFRPLGNELGTNAGGTTFTLDIGSISRVRDVLRGRGWSRERQDAAFLQLAKKRAVTLIPQSNQKVLTTKQREDAVRQGNQDKHLMSVRTKR